MTVFFILGFIDMDVGEPCAEVFVMTSGPHSVLMKL